MFAFDVARNYGLFSGGLLIAICLGCGGEAIPRLSQVEGTLTMDNQPLGDVKVTFLPDPEKENSGRASSGVTDASGRFTLMYEGPNKRVPGVALGWHRVTLLDLVAADSSRDENPIPQRFALAYNLASTTPISVEVKPGESQTVTLEVEAQ